MASTSFTSGATSVAVVGEALIDRFPDGDVIGGAPFNVARNLALLGASPLMITRIGDDELGRTVEDDFARFAMDTRGLQRDPAHPTGTVTVHMQGTHHRFEIGADAAWDHIDANDAVRIVAANRPRITYFGTLAQRSADSRDAIAKSLEASDALPFLDLNLRDLGASANPDNRALSESSLARARVVKVNDDELEQLIVWFGRPDQRGLAWGGGEHRAAVGDLVAKFGLHRLVITRGPDGWTCVDAKSGDWVEGSAAPVVVRDTVGAGDAFASVLLLGELGGWPLRSTLERAAKFASAVCGIAGAVDPASDIYEKALAEWRR